MKIRFSIFVLVVLILASVFCVSCNRSTPDGETADNVTVTPAQSTAVPTPETLESTSAETEPPATTAEQEKPLTPVEAMIKEVSEELESKGWDNLEVFEGEPPYSGTSTWGYLIVAPYDLSDDTMLYSVMGQSKDISDENGNILRKAGYMSAVVRIICDKDGNDPKQAEVFYTAECGRHLNDEYLEGFLNSYSKPNELLSADDKEMFDFFND